MRLTLDLNWRITLLSAALLPLFVALGVWQLHRAEEKRQLQAAFEARQQARPQALGTLDPRDVKAFTRVRVKGRFDGEYRLLLDNRTYNGRVGYEVIEPFLTRGDQWVLINRGWVKAPPSRSQQPAIPPAPAGEVTIDGRIHRPDGDRFQLAEQDFEQVSWPLVIQTLDMAQLSDLLQRPLYPHAVRIASTHPAALVAHWQPLAVKPEKHLGYAVQWFSMAAALLIGFVLANTNLWQLIRRTHTSEN